MSFRVNIYGRTAETEITILLSSIERSSASIIPSPLISVGIYPVSPFIPSLSVSERSSASIIPSEFTSPLKMQHFSPLRI